MTKPRRKRVPDAGYRAHLHEKLVADIVEASAPEKTLTKILGHVKKTLGFERYLVFFHDKDRGLTWVLGCLGFAKEDARRISFMRRALKHAITPRVARSGEPYFTRDAATDNVVDAYWRDKLRLRGPLLALPLKVGRKICGVLVVNDQYLSAKDEAVLAPFVNDLAVAVTAIEQAERLRARENTIGLMKKVQSSFAEAHRDERSFLNQVAEGIAEILNAQLCAIYRPLQEMARHDTHSNDFERKGAFGYPEHAEEDIRIPRLGRGKGLTNHVLAGQRLNVPNVEDDPKWWGKQAAELRQAIGSEIRAFLGIPMTDSSRSVIGAITLTRARVSEYDGLAFQEEDVTIVEAIGSAVAALLGIIDAREEVKKKHAELERKSAQTRLLVRNIAHQVSRPIMELKQSAYILSQNFSKEAYDGFRACLTELERGCRNFDTYEILTSDVAERGETLFRSDLLYILELVHEAYDRVLPYLKAEQREVVIAADSQCPPTKRVIGNHEAIVECFVNVLHNAVKYSKGNYCVDVRISQKQKAQIEVRITNYGIELPQSDREKVFEETTRTETAKAVAIEGSGLGLYLSRRLITIHGGEIEVESSEPIHFDQSEDTVWRTTFLISLKCEGFNHEEN